MCSFVDSALRENKAIAMYDIVYGVPSDQWFDSTYVVEKLGKLGFSSTESSVEASLRDWASAGILSRESGYYQVA